MRRVVIHQPDFAPYLGFFHRLVACDVLVLLDDVQFQKGGWNHRDKIKTASGPQWLTLPIHRGPLERKISDVPLRCDEPAAFEAVLAQVKQSYADAPCFQEVFAFFEQTMNAGFERMAKLNIELLMHMMRAFDVHPEVVLASELECPGRGQSRLVRLVQKVGGRHYLSGTGALAYLDPTEFESARITVEVQRFEHPRYPQLHGEFIGFLSGLDALFNCGSHAARLLREGPTEAGP